jgi:hypothetical protein
MEDDSERYWRALRMLRSQPPGWAKKGARRATFSAALTQSEELWVAGSRLSPETAPIVLFYALAQGGKALSAAGLKSKEWQGPGAHGLALRAKARATPDAPRLANYEVVPVGRGFVHVVAEVLESPVLAGAVDLATLACSLPEHDDFAFDAPGVARPLSVSLDPAHGPEPLTTGGLSVGPLPRHLVRSTDRKEYREMIAPSVAEVGDWLRAYPRLAALGAPVEVNYVNPMFSGDRDAYSVKVAVVLDAPMDVFESYRWIQAVLDVAAPGQGWGLPSSGITMPAIAGNGEAQAPLVAWWILAYAFSMLARYHPRAWTRLLDLDSSTEAVPVEVMLGTLASAIPRLLLQALLNTDSAAPQA